MCESDLLKMLSERETVLVADYDRALNLANFDVRHTVLDVATGSGRTLQQLVLRGFPVVSGDLDSAALDRARQRLGDLAGTPTLVVLDAHDLQFASDSFRAATLVNAIHEMENPRGVLDEMARVLTPDGKLLVVEFNSLGFELMELHHQAEGRGEHPTGEMSTEDIDRYLRSSFDCVEARELSITCAWVASGKRQRKPTVTL